jgi:hypothetical protein
MLFMLSVSYDECRKLAHCTVCHYAECRYAECCGALQRDLIKYQKKVL